MKATWIHDKPEYNVLKNEGNLIAAIFFIPLGFGKLHINK